jgi:hypothetical protein
MPSGARPGGEGKNEVEIVYVRHIMSDNNAKHIGIIIIHFS